LIEDRRLADFEPNPPYLASGSGRNWNVTTLLVVPFPANIRRYDAARTGPT
jgi:hypothetical protein